MTSTVELAVLVALAVVAVTTLAEILIASAVGLLVGFAGYAFVWYALARVRRRQHQAGAR